MKERAWINSTQQYQEMYDLSIQDPDKFWDEKAKELLHWFSPYSNVRAGSLTEGDIRWFENGKINVCYNCVDRHVLAGKGKQVAIISEGDSPDDVRSMTYEELQRQVSRVANLLKSMGIKKGDTVCIYLPMVIEAGIAMLACARIGAIHSVVFAGFSAHALASRIQDAKCRFVFTANESKRGGRVILLKHFVDEALKDCPTVESVVVLKNTNSDTHMHTGRDVWYHEVVPLQRPYCPCEWMDSEDPLFMLYTSGSTGKPKGILHTQGGYLLYTTITHRYIFDYHEGDIYACMADVGWITGHSYVVYGPLSNGATTFFFESTPLYPNPTRYFSMIHRHRITQFYTAPTAIRALMSVYKSEDVEGVFDLSSLRVLGSVGEPINPPAWMWYEKEVGRGECAVVDTYWQTETGGIVMTPLPGVTATKPGACCSPFFGVKPHLLDPQTGEELLETEAKGVLAFSAIWPSIGRTVFGDHERYLATYMQPYPGYYFSGDGAYRDKDGYYWIIGRVDDVISVSGHRIGTAEVESALVSHEACSEAAVVAVPHDVKGQAIFAYCCLKEGYGGTSASLVEQLRLAVRGEVGPFATPDTVLVVPGLPKTRSGKIMRRLLRKIATHETELGDVSTLADPSIVAALVDLVAATTNA